MEEHRRDKTRANYSADALVKSSNIGAIKGKLRDISIDALYLYISPIFFSIDDQVRGEIILDGVGSQLTMNVPAVVVRKDQHGIALSFLNPLEWWPIFSLFPLQSKDSVNIYHRKNDDQVSLANHLLTLVKGKHEVNLSPKGSNAT